MAELRKHRELSEIVFGLTLMEGEPNTINPHDVPADMLVYPYSAALAERRDKPEIANQAYLMAKYGADAINAAKTAAKQVHNGIPPEEWLGELTRVYQDYKIVSIMKRTEKKIEKDQGTDLEELKEAIDKRLADVTAEPLSWDEIKEEFEQAWVWAQWIPHAEVTLLVAHPGAGKSALALYLADCVANGSPLPDGSRVPETKKVLWCETEGRFAENVRRARAWGVDLSNMLIPSQDMRRVIDLNVPEDRLLVRSMAHKEDIGMVVIDSLGGSLIDENDASAKRTMLELSKIAQESRTTFLVIHHLRKKQKYVKGHQKITLADVRGHGGIVQFAPSVLAIDYEGNEMPRFLSPLKTNLVEMPTSISFTMGASGLVWMDDAGDTARRQYIHETAEWLERLLTPGVMTIKEVKEIAAQEGIDWDIVRKAANYPEFHTIHNQHGERCWGRKGKD